MAVLVAAVSSIVLLAYRAANPGQGAEHYFAREHHTAYRVMQVCYVVIMSAAAFNLRFLVGHFGSATVGGYIKGWTKRAAQR